MLLSEIEPKSEMTQKAIKDGVKTVEEYQFWMMGYYTGYSDRQSEVSTVIMDTIRNGL